MRNKLTVILCPLLLGVLAACQTAGPEMVTPPAPSETSVPETVTPPAPPTPQETRTPEESPPVEEIETPIDVSAIIDIPIHRPFEPSEGNVLIISHSFFNTLFLTDCSIWKIPDRENFSEPKRMMDTVDSIQRVIADNTHIITTDGTLYFLDFDNGEAVRQLENVTSFYHFHFGTARNPLRYVRTADGAAWRVDQAQPIRLPDDYVVRCSRPFEEEIFDVIYNQWFDYVRNTAGSWVLTEDNALWRFDSWQYDAVPTKIAEDIQTLYHGFVITTDNVLWRLPPWDDEEAGLNKIMENVESISGSLIITRDNELWGYRRWYGWQDEEPFKIMANVQSVQPPSSSPPFGFIAMDNTLWWLPNWIWPNQGLHEPIPVKDNVLRTWRNWLWSQYIMTTDGSLWLFNYEGEYNYFVQVFQAVAE